MYSHNLVAHTADTRLHIRANSLEELFAGTLAGMNELLKRDGCRRTEEDFEEWLSITAPDGATLLIDFLSEILTLSNAKKMLFCRAEFRKLTENKLEACLFGTYAGSFDEEVKAVSCHKLSIARNVGENYETNVAFDI